jgi:hypothetical protein
VRNTGDYYLRIYGRLRSTGSYRLRARVEWFSLNADDTSELAFWKWN